MCFAVWATVLGLLLLGSLRAFPQDRVPTEACSGKSNYYYSKDAGKCCYRCPPSQTSTEPCPQGPSNCRKSCDPEHYLSREGRCLACVTCTGDDLVEKVPCSGNSSRVCQCRAGMFCSTSATNSCARCSLHTVCSQGTVVIVQGTAEKDTVCGSPTPATSSNCSASTEDCKSPVSGSTQQVMPSQTMPASSDAKTVLHGLGSPPTPDDASKMKLNSLSSMEKTSAESELSSQQPCPPESLDCRKQCDLEYYLDQAGRCLACVSCTGEDLVEKTPCKRNSSRVCECRPGMFCATSATNSCARCVPHPICPPGKVAKLQGLAERDSAEKLLPLEVLPDCSTNPEDKVASSTQSSEGQAGGVTHTWEDESTPTSVPIPFSSSTGKPVFIPGSTLPWLIMLVVVLSSCFFLYYCRTCKKWIQQKLHLRHPDQTPPPQLVLVDSNLGRNPTELKKSLSVADSGTEELGLLNPPAVETCSTVGAACPEMLRLQEASPYSGSLSPSDLPEPQVTSEHTNNRIEKIYIMKADTVIVGTVKTELPEERGSAGSVGPEFEEDLAVDYATHYPEQETEPPVSSSGDVMFSVEEEGKEDFSPTATSEK